CDNAFVRDDLQPVYQPAANADVFPRGQRVGAATCRVSKCIRLPGFCLNKQLRQPANLIFNRFALGFLTVAADPAGVKID
ncbi:MAG: hypothetical protein OXC81_06975, partial [Betaproteobacteria bacterium]|nr:hypothetical protein [Betaproteobacteria bacterium]